MAKRLARINNKYLKYVDDEELIEGFDYYKKKQIEDIIELGSTIGMFEGIIDLDLGEEGRKIEACIDNFLETIEIRGIRREFRDILTQQTTVSLYLKNALEIEKWCKESFRNKEIWERRLPSSQAKDENEKKIGISLSNIRQSILNQYEGKELGEIENEKDRRIAQIIRKLDEEYGLSKSLKNALEIENWCKISFRDKEIWERRLPSSEAKDENEKRLGQLLSDLRQRVLKQYEGKELGEIKNEVIVWIKYLLMFFPAIVIR